MKTKIIIGLAAAAVLGYGLFLWQIRKTGQEAERANQAEKRAEEHERLKKEAIARADSLNALHLKELATADRQRVFADSIIKQLDRYGKRIVLIREYENDSIVGSLDLTRHLKLFTEWRQAAEDGSLN